MTKRMPAERTRAAFGLWTIFARSGRALAVALIAALVATLVAVLPFVVAAQRAAADEYPAKPIRLIVPYPAGGGVDLVARIFQQKLSEILGQQIIIENRPGASGAVGAQVVAKAEADGYTLLFCAGDFMTIPQLMPQMTFSPLKELLPVAMVTDSPMVLVAGGDAPFGDIKGVVEAANANPNGLAYATPGQGTVNNVVGQWIAVTANIRMLHVAYRSGAAAAEGIAGGEVPLGVVQPPAVYPGLVEAHKIKVIALTGMHRPDFLPPTWPTLAESGLPIDATIWLGLFAPIETPAPIVDRLDAAIAQLVQDGGVRKRMNDAGIAPEHLGPAPFGERVRADTAHYDAIIRQAGMKFEQ
jgi:tripartite-type tricarboxylate transporter receptor subunit TctC